MVGKALVGIVVASLIGVSASAVQPAGQRRLQLSGGCSSLIAGGTDFSQVCMGKMIAIVDPNGDTTYAFMMGDGGVLNFHGVDAAAIGNGQDFFDVRTVSLIDRTKGNKVDSATASGRCYYDDPWSGVAKVRCDAVAQGKNFSARFTTDGQPPVG